MSYTIRVYMNYPWRDIIGVELLDSSGKQLQTRGYTEYNTLVTSCLVHGEMAANVIFNTLAEGLE